ncbi:HNH endonuclease, partial [Mycobacterium barrassiae]|nr:HNH endonuclease [Mycobacterium barrassiae]
VLHSAAPVTSDAHRGLAMPRRASTRAQNRAKAIDDERAHNQAARHAETQQAREPVDKPQPEWVNDYFPPTPPPPNDNDPPPF